MAGSLIDVNDESKARRWRDRITYLAAVFPLVVALAAVVRPDSDAVIWGVIGVGTVGLISLLLWQRRTFGGNGS